MHFLRFFVHCISEIFASRLSFFAFYIVSGSFLSGFAGHVIPEGMEGARTSKKYNRDVQIENRPARNKTQPDRLKQSSLTGWIENISHIVAFRRRRRQSTKGKNSISSYYYPLIYI